MPLIVKQGNGPESLAGTGSLELVGRLCKLAGYKKIQNIPTFQVAGDLIAYSSPDSTYAVTRRLLDAARKEIIIGIYDFSAEYMKEILLHAIRRGVKVSLMLDIDGSKEEKLFEELKKFGCEEFPPPPVPARRSVTFPLLTKR